MGELVFTFCGDQIYINKRRLLLIDRTNLPRDLKKLNKGVYWSAKIIRYDEGQAVLHAEIENYSASKSDFDNAGNIPSSLRKIHFASLNGDAIDAALGRTPKRWAPPSTQIHESTWQNKSLLQDVPLREENYPLTVNVSADEGKLGAKDGYFFYQYTPPGGEKINLSICRYQPPGHSWPSTYLFRHKLGKDTIEVVITLNQGKLEARSSDLEKFAPQEGISTLPKPIPEEVQDYKHYSRTSLESSQDSPGLDWVEKEEICTVKMKDLEYAPGAVSFQLHLQGSNKRLQATIYNPAIVPEFKHVERYFSKIIGKSSINAHVKLRIKHDFLGRVSEGLVLSTKSADIDKIDPSVVTEVQKDYCVDHLFAGGERTLLESVDDLLSSIKNPELKSADALIEAITEKRSDCKHTLQLKYLAGRHLAEVQPLKFGREKTAKTFLFVVRGKNSLYLVLEAINDTLATYIWACPESAAEIALKTKEVENLVCSFEENRRRAYRKGHHEGFFLIEHKYQNENNDFLTWQEEFLEIIGQ